LGYVVSALLGYLLGSIPVALLVAARYGVDLRVTGDGNPGAWNALEQLGARRAWPVFIGDAFKAFAAGVAGWLLAGWWGAFAGVAGAMAGHAFPLFARFQGGKAVMCFVGGAFVLSPYAALVCLGVCGAVTAASSFKWGARVGVFGFPFAALIFSPVWQVAAVGGLMSFIGLLFFVRPGAAVAASG